jgi:hypothetical protein
MGHAECIYSDSERPPSIPVYLLRLGDCRICVLPLATAFRSADQYSATVHHVAETCDRTLRECPLPVQLEAKGQLEWRQGGNFRKDLVLTASSDLVSISRKRKDDLVTPNGHGYIQPMPTRSMCFAKVYFSVSSGGSFQIVEEDAEDFVNGTFQGTGAEEADLKTNIVRGGQSPK